MLHPLVRPGWVRSAGPTLGVAAGSAGPVHLEGRGGSKGGAWSWDPAPTGRGSLWHRARGPGGSRGPARPVHGGGPRPSHQGPGGGGGCAPRPDPGARQGPRATRFMGGEAAARTPGRLGGVHPPSVWTTLASRASSPSFILFLGSLCNTLRFAQEWGASHWLIQVCHFSPLGFIKVCHQVGGTWRSFYWDNERRRG